MPVDEKVYISRGAQPSSYEDAQAAFEAGDLAGASAVCDALAGNGDHDPRVANLRAVLPFVGGDKEAAVGLVRTAAAAFPGDAEIRYNHGLISHSLGLFSEARLALSASMELAHGWNKPVHALSLLLSDLKEYPQARALCEIVLADDPEHADALHQLGICLQLEGQYDAAVSVWEKALRWSAHPALLHSWIASIFFVQGKTELAALQMERALELASNDPDIRWNAAILALSRQRFAEGWPLYEWRFAAGKSQVHPVPVPVWTGQPLNGLGLLIQAEQGLGDEIMFMALLPELLADPRTVGARIVIATSPSLTDLWRRAFPGVEFMAVQRRYPPYSAVLDLETLGKVDYQLPLNSLAGMFRLTAMDFLRQRPYLAGRVRFDEPQRCVVPNGGRPLIGLVWKAGHPDVAPRIRFPEVQRSMEIQDLQALSRSDVDWISLQFGVADSDVPPFVRLNPGKDLADFNDTAAILKQLDGLVSVDTSIVHLAAALGVPCAVLLPKIGEWRWGDADGSGKWWPDVRVIRQKVTSDWQGPIEQVCAELAAGTLFSGQ